MTATFAPGPGSHKWGISEHRKSPEMLSRSGAGEKQRTVLPTSRFDLSDFIGYSTILNRLIVCDASSPIISLPTGQRSTINKSMLSILASGCCGTG
jgi:hypothetical protein